MQYQFSKYKAQSPLGYNIYSKGIDNCNIRNYTGIEEEELINSTYSN